MTRVASDGPESMTRAMARDEVTTGLITRRVIRDRCVSLGGIRPLLDPVPPLPPSVVTAPTPRPLGQPMLDARNDKQVDKWFKFLCSFISYCDVRVPCAEA